RSETDRPEAAASKNSGRLSGVNRIHGASYSGQSTGERTPVPSITRWSSHQATGSLSWLVGLIFNPHEESEFPNDVERHHGSSWISDAPSLFIDCQSTRSS